MLGENIKATPGSLSMRRVSLKACIAWAYDVFEYQVNGPDWIGSQTYDVRGEGVGPAAAPDLRLMLQTLLADRFHLSLHRQAKEIRCEKTAFMVGCQRSGRSFLLKTRFHHIRPPVIARIAGARPRILHEGLGCSVEVAQLSL